MGHLRTITERWSRGTLTVSDSAQADPARAHELLALLTLAAAGLLRSERPREYVRRVFDSLAPRIGLDAYFNFLVRSQGGAERLRLDSCAGVDRETASEFAWLDFGVAVCGQVAQQRKARAVPDVQLSTETATELIRTLGITAYAAFPLLVQGHLVGTLSFGSRSRRNFEPDDLELLRAVADLVAVAIHRHQRFQEAEQLNHSMKQFLSMLSHDLRTPITSVVGLTQLLRSEVAGPLDDKQQDYLARIETASWMIVRMLEQILTFFRSAEGPVTVEQQSVDVSRIVEETAVMLTPEARAKGVDVIVRECSGTPLRTDADKLRQVLGNLIGNAIKYTDEGAVEILVEDGLHEVAFHVRDTGCGIPEDRLEDIFQPFTRLNGDSTESGAGLGLAICRRLADALGGSVAVRSQPGTGSTFTLRVPRAPE